jgi:hypothetical protein
MLLLELRGVSIILIDFGNVPPFMLSIGVSSNLAQNKATAQGRCGGLEVRFRAFFARD